MPHGRENAGQFSRYWHRVVPLLEQAGFEAIAVDLPADLWICCCVSMDEAQRAQLFRGEVEKRSDLRLYVSSADVHELHG